MADVLEESVDMANVIGINKGIEVIWDPCDFSVLKCDSVVGYSKRFKQILDNLLGNAMKFTQEGHVIIRAWANRPFSRDSIGAPSRFACQSLGNNCFRFFFGAKENRKNSFDPMQNDPNLVEFYFEVVDTGIGIPKEKRKSVFENYVQVKEGHGGTGLGLGIVQSFVRLMGGEIDIKEKEPGERGTCFAFNVLLKIRGSRETEDIEGGPSTVSESYIRASVFREANCFRGWHCILFVHGDETSRVLQAWMENIGMKVWMVPDVELITSTLEKAQSPHDDCDADRCFGSKEMVTQVLPTTLRKNNGMMACNLGEHHPVVLLFILDVSNGQFEDIQRQATNFAKMKRQFPCKFVWLTDLRTSSKDFRRLEEMSCELVLRKPVHGSRLYALLMTLRDVQSSPMHKSSPLGHQNSCTRKHDVCGTCMKDSATTVASAQVELKTEDDRPLDGMHVLLVEDTLVLQTIQRKVLNQLGATVELAGDGAKAVDMFIDAIERASIPGEHNVPLPYDVIFMDCQMPEMDGYEATRRIREQESRYRIRTPIIALTAHSMEEDLQKAIHAGMDLHMTKPIERIRIVEAVHGVCKKQ